MTVRRGRRRYVREYALFLAGGLLASFVAVQVSRHPHGALAHDEVAVECGSRRDVDARLADGGYSRRWEGLAETGDLDVPVVLWEGDDGAWVLARYGEQACMTMRGWQSAPTWPR